MEKISIILIILLIIVLILLAICSFSGPANPQEGKGPAHITPLTVEKDSNTITERIVGARNNIKLFEFTLKNSTTSSAQATTSSDFDIESLIFVRNPETTFPVCSVENLRLIIDNTQVGFVENLAEQPMRTELVVPVASLTKLELFGDITSTAATGTLLRIDLIDIKAKSTRTGIEEEVAHAHTLEPLSRDAPLSSSFFYIIPE